MIGESIIIEDKSISYLFGIGLALLESEAIVMCGLPRGKW
jgi:hypothetical protein